MRPPSVFLAVDLGAGSGRVMAVTLSSGGISIQTVHRFESPAIKRAQGLFWDFESIYQEILAGLRVAGRDFDPSTIRSIGVDSWAVDYGWLDASGSLLRDPYCYRDARMLEVYEDTISTLGRETIFKETGIQFLSINTLYQIASDLAKSDPIVGEAAAFLMIPDLVNHRLTGKLVCERTNASTTQLYNPVTAAWSDRLARGLGLRPETFPDLIDPGAVIGPLHESAAKSVGLPRIPVIATASHDTASAVAGVPAASADFNYLSCGTWALFGAEVAQPDLSAQALASNFTNEVGYGGTIRLLKNITGLWLIQECRRAWGKDDGSTLSYEDLAVLAEAVGPADSFVDPDDPRFASPGQMPDKIRAFCQETGQPVPESRGQILRVATESLALKVAATNAELRRLLGEGNRDLHVVGGGVQNQLLLQCIANATGQSLLAGPVEATACGNALVQMLATGHLESLAEGRALVASSMATRNVDPKSDWSDRRRTFERLRVPSKTPQ